MAIIESRAVSQPKPQGALTRKGVMIPRAPTAVSYVPRGLEISHLVPHQFLYLLGGLLLFSAMIMTALVDISGYRLGVSQLASHLTNTFKAGDYFNDLVLDDELALDDRVSTKEQESIKEFFSMTPQDNERRQEVLKVTYERSPESLVQQVHRIIATTNRHKEAQAFTLARSIVSEAMRQGYDPLFVAAVIKSESAFNTLAVSNVGAQGLMQIMPATGKYLAQKHDISLTRAVRLSDPQINITLGIKYLRELEQTYQGNRLLTLIAYNWGPGKLDRAIKSGKGVPAECLRYALKILKDHNYWEFNG